MKAINDSILMKQEGASTNPHKLSDDLVDKFLSSTSSACLLLMYTIGQYCNKVKELNVSPPVVRLKDLAETINNGRKDESFSMYLFACLVVLSSFGVLSYSTVKEQLTEVTFSSIDDSIEKKVKEQLKERDLNSSLEPLDRFINSLFEVNDNSEEDANDGSETD